MQNKLATTEDTGDTEENPFPWVFFPRVLRVPRGGEVSLIFRTPTAAVQRRP